MKKLYVVLGGVLAVVLLGVGTVAAMAAPSNLQDWALADGKADYSKLPDVAEVSYTCWNGKSVTLSGKTIKQKAAANPLPGSKEYELGVAKSKELAAIPGVVTKDARGAEVVNIDDTNEQVQAVMQKYEAQETPECR